MKNPFKRKVHVLKYCIAQHTILNIGKSLLLIIGYTDAYYSAFGEIYLLNNRRRITEDLVLNDEKAFYNSHKRYIRYKFFKLLTLPFNITYRWEGTNITFKIHPKVWIRLNKVK